MVTRKKPTIVDVARAAGVSVGSASNVLNRTRFVSDEIREKVLRTADELQYFANPLAQTLRRKRSGVICFCTTSVTTVYLRSLADALDAVATSHGFELVQVLTHADPARELARVRSQIGRQVDGLLLLPSLEPQESLDAIALSETPCVVLDRYVDDDRFSCVAFDNQKTMREITRLILASGHERILFVAQNLSVITTRHRIEGLKQEMLSAGLSLRDCLIIQKDETQYFYAKTLVKIFDSPTRPTAIIAGNSKVAIETIRQLKLMNIRWPEDVSLASFDNPEWAEILPIQLSTVDSPIDAMAQAAWAMLSEKMRVLGASRRVRWIDSTFILRDSVQPPPIKGGLIRSGT